MPEEIGRRTHMGRHSGARGNFLPFFPPEITTEIPILYGTTPTIWLRRDHNNKDTTRFSMLVYYYAPLTFSRAKCLLTFQKNPTRGGKKAKKTRGCAAKQKKVRREINEIHGPADCSHITNTFIFAFAQKDTHKLNISRHTPTHRQKETHNERHRETERDTPTLPNETATHRQWDTETQNQTQKERHTDTDTHRERDTGRDTMRQTQIETHRDRERHSDTHSVHWILVRTSFIIKHRLKMFYLLSTAARRQIGPPPGWFKY